MSPSKDPRYAARVADAGVVSMTVIKTLLHKIYHLFRFQTQFLLDQIKVFALRSF
jgi:hypothetical protein